jgi:hypothetical protein
MAAIIHNYLSMVDEEAEKDSRRESMAVSDSGLVTVSRTSTAPATSLSSVTTATSTSTGAGGVLWSEDESHQKRRASPTELQPERSLANEVKEGAELARRVSVKRMRPGPEAGSGHPLGLGSGARSAGSGSGSGGASGMGGSMTSSPVTVGRKKGSKFGLGVEEKL